MSGMMQGKMIHLTIIITCLLYKSIDDDDDVAFTTKARGSRNMM